MVAGATSKTSVALIERLDIHKSCKALEAVVNVLNEYCQAAESLAIMQKKLAKALKDTAGLKATNELTANALNAVANLFDFLAEIEAKFVKAADRECEDVSNELKKWFKKLAKEEKNHDDRIASANSKIKQAGQAYEKKAKRRDRDAAEEHTRYVNILSVVGPEMSQENYNHTLFVTQRHTSTLYNVVSSISRTADAEWMRVCESVKRFAPVIGRVGEYRAYLEGGWTSDASTDIREESQNEEDENGEEQTRVNDVQAHKQDSDKGEHVAKPIDGTSNHPPAPVYTPDLSTGSATTPSSTSSQIPSNSPATSSIGHGSPSPPSSFPSATPKLNTDSVRSIESLSSFPSPPTHFPIPAIMPTFPSPLSQVHTPVQVADVKATAEQPTSDTSRAPVQGSMKAVDEPELHPDPSSSTHNIESRGVAKVPSDLVRNSPVITKRRSLLPTQGVTVPQDLSGVSEPTLASLSKTDMKITDVRSESPEQHLDVRSQSGSQDSRQGELTKSGHDQTSEFGERVNEEGRNGMERMASIASTHSIVASMKDKLTRGNGPSSPRERDIPSVPNKVSDLASRYHHNRDQPPSPQSPRGTSPTLERARASSFQDRKPASGTSHPTDIGAAHMHKLPSISSTSAPSVQSPTTEQIAARRRRIEELEELELREQAHALRERERQVELRAFDLERERERLRVLSAATTVPITTAPAPAPAMATVIPRVPHGRPYSQNGYSYSASHLALPRATPLVSSSSSGAGDAPRPRPTSQYGSEPFPRTQSSPASTATSTPSPIPQPPIDHAPYCGCYACSAAQYRQPPSSQPQLPTRVEKPKSWMRRLSMPVVGGAFSSDSKKPALVGGGLAPPRYEQVNGGQLNARRSFEQDATGGISNVTRSRKLSFTRR